MRSTTRRQCLLMSLIALLLLGSLWSSSAVPAVQAEGNTAPQALDWIEPRALNVFDLAGQVPDSLLQGYIVSYGPGGLARYRSGQRNGSEVVVTLDLNGRLAGGPGDWYTVIQMPGQPSILDHMGSVAPACWMRLYVGGQDITDAVIMWAKYTTPDLVKPQRGAGSADRYPNQTHDGVTMSRGAGGVLVPANFGGTVVIIGQYTELTAVLTATVPDSPTVRLVGTQHDTFQSYIGPGGVGVFQDLLAQLRGRYGDRHARIHLARPAEANYVLFNYAPTPFEPYATADYNIQRPAGGTVRLAPDEAMLSADLSIGGAFPLNVAWQDADQSAGPMLSPLPRIDRITPPEYVIPAGIAWRDCFLRGDCSSSVLDQIYHQVSTIDTLFLQVTPSSEDVLAIHLEMADETWQASVAIDGRSEPALRADQSYRVWLPTMLMQLSSAPNLPTAPVPYGYFSNGRMVGYGQ